MHAPHTIIKASFVPYRQQHVLDADNWSVGVSVAALETRP